MSPTSMDVLASGVFAVVSQYLDADSTVRLSRTCRSLHSSLVHDEDGTWHPKIKIPCFSMGDQSLWRHKAGRRLPPGRRRGVVTSLFSVVLPRIHFSSLKKLEFRWGSEGIRGYTNSSSDINDAFLHLAIGLGEATNLEELHLDTRLLIQYESVNLFTAYKIFAKNLARCKNLKKLKVTNYLVRSSQSHYSAGLLLALVPALAQGASMLEEVTLAIGNTPAAMPATRGERNAARDLFLAILRLRNLRELNLRLDLATSPLLNVLLDAASLVRAESVWRSSSDRAPPSTCAIEKFTLRCKLHSVPEGTASLLPAPLSLAPMLALLGQADNLRMFKLRVPPACLDPNAMAALGEVLCGKPTLSCVCLHFDNYECPRRCLKCLLAYVREREAFPDNLIYLSGLGCVDGHGSEQEKELERYHRMNGRRCLSRNGRGILFQALGPVIRR